MSEDKKLIAALPVTFFIEVKRLICFRPTLAIPFSSIAYSRESQD